MRYQQMIQMFLFLQMFRIVKRPGQILPQPQNAINGTYLLALATLVFTMIILKLMSR